MATGTCTGNTGRNVPPQCGCAAVICNNLNPGSYAVIDPSQPCCTFQCALPNGDLSNVVSCAPNSVPYPPAASESAPIAAILVGVVAAGGMIFLIERHSKGQALARGRASGQSRRRHVR